VVAALLVGSQARCPNEACRDNLSIYDQILTFIFLLEVVIKFLSGGLNFLDYFTNKERWWNVLDLTVVTCSFLPSIGSMALVLRMVRLLRVLKVVRIVPQLRMLVLALSKSGESIMFTTFLVSGRHQCSKRSECFESILILTCLFHFLRLDPNHHMSVGSQPPALPLLLRLRHLRRHSLPRQRCLPFRERVSERNRIPICSFNLHFFFLLFISFSHVSQIDSSSLYFGFAHLVHLFVRVAASLAATLAAQPRGVDVNPTSNHGRRLDRYNVHCSVRLQIVPSAVNFPLRRPPQR
jgi:hypothetical protein